LIESLQRWAAGRTYRVAWGSPDVVGAARAEILGRRASAELDDEFFAREIRGVVGEEDGRSAGAVVVVAVPRTAWRVSFDLGEARFVAIIPPTYVRYRALFEEVRQDLAANGLPGAKVEHLVGPLKAVAARLGLVRYGRNNVTYAPGVGSYMQLCGYVTDAQLPTDERELPQARAFLPECDDCRVCRSACPTGAIADDRLLLHAHRCLTYANENPGVWPGWVPARAHNCLLGCLRCQRACPANPKLKVADSGVLFSAAETRALLENPDALDERNEAGVRYKLAWLGQPYVEPVLGRNLRALLEVRGRTMTPS